MMYTQNNVVGILPMSPLHATKLGFFSIFAYANRMALIENAPTVYGVNTCGKPGSNHVVPMLQDSVRLLNIQPTRWWQDSSITGPVMEDVIIKILREGLVHERELEVRRCSCGKVEHLGGITLFGTGKTLIEGKYARCCHSQIVSYRERVLVTAPLPVVEVPEVFPLWAERELRTVLQTLAGSQLLISRKTQRLFRVSLMSGGMWELDNDLLWWLYLKWLQGDGMKVKHLVAGASVVRHVGIMLAFSKLIGVQLPRTVHCLPKVFFEPIHDVATLEQAVSRFGEVRITNALIWSAFSARKHFTLHGSMFPRMCTTIPASDSFFSDYRSLLCQG